MVHPAMKVTMAELKLKSNWTKLKTIPHNIFISANLDETSYLKEY